ncbi:MAG: glycosyltransferase family 4 protein [Flavobacteriales bacterium]|nr:glycosyltransferase family 4 protein [Flavobacteriales bacterium]
MGIAIAYIAPAPYAFVRKDIEGLRECGIDVRVHYFGNRAWRLPIALLNQFMSLLWWRLSGIDVALVHFAGYHAMLPVLLGFKTFIIIAGADACAFPGIEYGSFRKPTMSAAMRFAMRGARALLPVHRSLERFENRYSTFGPMEQGYARFVPGLRTRSVPVPYGFDAQAWRIPEDSGERTGAICVATGAVNGNAIHFRKGIDLIIEAARALPEVPFTVVGATDSGSYTELPSNLRVRGGVSQDELRSLLSASSLYLQPSVMEGFPNALCEAMLCGCLPVVSSMTSMPEIAGQCGAVIPNRRPEALVEAIRKLTAIEPGQAALQRVQARERILEYDLSRRMASLCHAIGMEMPSRQGE